MGGPTGRLGRFGTVMPPAVLLRCQEVLELFRHPEAEIEEGVAVNVDAPQAITTRQAET